MSTSTNVHLTGYIDPKVKVEFNDYLDCGAPFRTLKLIAGDHEVNVFFMEHGGPNLADTLQQIIEAATAKLDELSALAWVNAVSELGVKS
jgi:hypothetical protein